MRPKISLLSIFLLLGMSAWAVHADCATSFQRGNQAYQHGEYVEAIGAYRNCLGQGVRSSDVYYNLGNAYFRADSLGKAILYYESALRLDPGNDDIAYNLKFAMSRKIDKEKGDEENPVLQALFRLHHALDLDTQFTLLAVFAWIFCAQLATLILVRQEKVRNVLFGTLAATILLGSPGALSAGYKAWILETRQLGVVTVRAADVYSGPGTQYQVLNELHEGTRFEVRDVRDGWVSLRVDDRVGGFVQANQVGLVDIQ